MDIKKELKIVYECHECPLNGGSEDFNPADPGEGYYKCTHLNKDIWGEVPECDYHVFQKLALELLKYRRG